MDKIFELIAQEEQRQQETLMMIPSENYTYPEVRKAVGSVLMHKYAEGYPGKRYYQGMSIVDRIENLAIKRAKSLFKVPHANVQPYSGSPANAAVYFALLNPGDTIMGLKLSHGGHLTHGHPKITFSGKYFNSISYQVADTPPYFDFEAIREKALKNEPKIIIVGATAVPRKIPWEEFSKIAQETGSFLLADISHIAGLVVGGAHPSPVPFADIITSTTHKTLRGPRGALIMATEKGLKKDLDLGKKLDRAVFPGLQGGPHLHTIAGIALALEKAAQPEFKKYAKQIVKNAKALADALLKNNFNLVMGGTDNHLLLIDLRNKNISGKEAAEILEKAGIITNANTIPNDPNPPFKPSGLRLGTPAVTARGMREAQMKKIGEWIGKVLINKDAEVIRKEVKALCEKYPLD